MIRAAVTELCVGLLLGTAMLRSEVVHSFAPSQHLAALSSSSTRTAAPSTDLGATRSVGSASTPMAEVPEIQRLSTLTGISKEKLNELRAGTFLYAMLVQDGEAHEGVEEREWMMLLAVRDYLNAGNTISSETTMMNILTQNYALKQRQAKVQKFANGDVYRTLAQADESQLSGMTHEDVPQKIHLSNTSLLPLADMPELDLISRAAPPFVSQDGWLRDLVQRTFSCARGTDSPDGTYRVPLTSLARCSRGGKTRALLELEKQLSQGISTLFVSFNDFSDCEDEIERGDSSLEMLCRRIAFAARPQEHRAASPMEDFEDFKKCIVSGEDVKAWLGDQHVILLIDELNRIDLDKQVVNFLTKTFCVREGRYYVFSSHLSTTNPEVAAPSESFRRMDIVDLPLIEDLSVAKTCLNITGLSPRLALYYGLIPALLVTSLTVQGLADGRQVDQRVTKACKDLKLDFDLFQTVLDSFFSGKAMESRLDVLMDGGSTKNYWIPCYLMELLKKLGAGIGGEFGLGLRDVASDSEGCSTCKEGSGDGWESLFLLVLWLRFASGRTMDAGCIPNISIPVKDISKTLRYNRPFPMTKCIYKVKDVEEFQAALDEIQNDYPWVGTFPKVSIYYPKLANFAEYDVFVCVWQKNVSGIVTRELYGYQLKEGKEIPGKPATLTHSYLVRGYPAFNAAERRGWKLLAKPELQVFFGVSGERWLPEKWRGLAGSQQ